METNVNGYQIVKELNKGAFCDAYLVRKDGKDYFMKVYKDPTVLSPDYKDFKKNQETMAPLLRSLGDKTETIVEQFEVSKVGRFYQIKELIPGGNNLRDWLEADGDYDHRLNVAVQFCDILMAVHDKNIIHQDLKPEQVMTVVDPSKPAGIRIILTDFDWSVPNGKVVRYVGTPGYSNIDGTSLSFKSDIFTFGIILTELLTGANPYFIAESGEELIFEPTQWEQRVKNEDYLAPNKINDELPPEINNIIVRCLKPKQSDRPSLAEIRKVLTPEGRKKAKIVSKTGEMLIMVPGKAYGRDHFKALFKETKDSDDNQVYKYLDPTFAILNLTQTGSQLMISCPAYGKAKNKIMLNKKELTDKPTPINEGDQISIYSTSKGTDVAIFTVKQIS